MGPGPSETQTLALTFDVLETNKQTKGTHDLTAA